MNESLRPSTLGEILDRTANLYRSRFLLFFGLAAMPAGVMLGSAGGMILLMTWSGAISPTAATTNPQAIAVMVLGMMAIGLVALPLMIGANALCGAALCHAASVVILGGTITIVSSLKAVWKRGWHYVGLLLLQAVIILGAPSAVWSVVVTLLLAGAAVAAGTGGAAGGLLAGALAVLMVLGLAVYVVWMLLQLGLAFPIAVVEQANIGVALKRAWQLCKGTRWRMLALFALVMALSQVASLLVMVPVALLIAFVPGLSSPQNAQLATTVMMIGVYGMSFVMNALTMPVIAIALVLFYYDQRVRKEGFDIEWMMQQAGMIAAPPPQPVLSPWLPAPVREGEVDAVAAHVAPEDEGPGAARPERAEPQPSEPVGGEHA
jgi:hypothetical protein